MHIGLTGAWRVLFPRHTCPDEGFWPATALVRGFIASRASETLPRAPAACQTLLLGLVGRSRGGYPNGDQTKRRHSGRSRLNDISSGSLPEEWWFPNAGLLRSVERVSSLPRGLCHFAYPVPPRHWPRGEGRPVPAHRRVWAPAALRFQVALIWVLAPESDPGVVPGETQHKLSNNLGKDFPSRDS